MRKEEKEKLLTIMNEAFMNLKAQIRIWKINYLLLSPVDGTVTFTKYWSENQTVVEGEPVLYVVPENAGELVGRTNLRMQRSGKVKIGYTVNIKLSSFPYLEYGMVRGLVKSKSLVPSGDGYMIEISLPDGLTTLYGNKLEFTQNMQGTAEIITENIRLLQKIINPFRYLVTKNKKI
jgi:HlyD family secretion protein